MSAYTKIEWTDKTWNPVRGCALVSEGCRNCYAMKQAHRFSGPGQPYEGLTELGPAGPRWTGTIRTVDEALLEPLRWRKPQRIFVNSMSDLFHEGVPDEFIDRVFALMAACPRHTFQILTKRPERMWRYVAALGEHIAEAMTNGDGAPRWDEARRWVYRHVRDSLREFVGVRLAYPTWPLLNVWLGMSAENQKTLDERFDYLRQTPAAVRFVSAEPLLGGLDIAKHRPGANRLWFIVGGESGPGARRCDVKWIRSIVRQCQQADAPVFVKQLGANVIDRNDAGFEGDPEDSWTSETRYEDLTPQGWQGDPVRIRLRDRKGGDMSEWPEDLRVRQFPETKQGGVSA